MHRNSTPGGWCPSRHAAAAQCARLCPVPLCWQRPRERDARPPGFRPACQALSTAAASRLTPMVTLASGQGRCFRAVQGHTGQAKHARAQGGSRVGTVRRGCEGPASSSLPTASAGTLGGAPAGGRLAAGGAPSRSRHGGACSFVWGLCEAACLASRRHQLCRIHLWLCSVCRGHRARDRSGWPSLPPVAVYAACGERRDRAAPPLGHPPRLADFGTPSSRAMSGAR